MSKTPIVISLGGSLVAPVTGFDLKFLKDFRALATDLVRKGERLILVIGGGGPARKYQDAAKALGKTTPADLDWIGIMATRLNAQLVKQVLGRLAPLPVVTDPSKPPTKKVPVLVASGWKPGWSTDYDAALLAKKLGAKVVVNLSNIAYVYSADPKKDPNAVPLEALSWKHYRQIAGSKWSPGLNRPFDPIASALAAKTGLVVKVLDGKSLSNIRAALTGKKFKGTVIG